jgi:hypothetical protein
MVGIGVQDPGLSVWSSDTNPPNSVVTKVPIFGFLHDTVPRQEMGQPQSRVDGILQPTKAPTTLKKFMSQDDISMLLSEDI